MAGERKKRKMESEGKGEEEEDGEEERKMEMFFALIRSTRDVRDRLRGGLNEAKEKGSSEDHQKKLVEKEIKVIWNPTFRPEDFMQDDKSKRPPGDVQEAGPSKREKGEGDEKEDDKEGGEGGGGGGGGNGIDLNLSL